MNQRRHPRYLHEEIILFRNTGAQKDVLSHSCEVSASHCGNSHNERLIVSVANTSIYWLLRQKLMVAPGSSSTVIEYPRADVALAVLLVSVGWKCCA